nr:hypothetical protein [uncultured Oscillibacter sp.]
MKKAEMREKFRQLLEAHWERLAQAVQQGDKQTAERRCGEIFGIAEAMRALELADYDQVQYIRDQARALCRGKELDHAAC